MLLSDLRKLIPNSLVNFFYHLPLSLMAVVFYRYPAKNLFVIGITGTDGKTTTSTLIYEILRLSGKKVALITSVSAKIGNKDLDTGFHVTTPDACKLQKLLRYIADKGINYVVLESTSHGLSQYRLVGCNFRVGVITNVTWEHIDYHRTWKDYLKAKARLFAKTHFSILNADDKSYQYLKNHSSGVILTYGLKEADYTPKTFPFKTKLPGTYNQYNCLAALAVGKAIGIADQDIRNAIGIFSGVVGRMEKITHKPFTIIVDFAHTPNGLENALSTLKAMPHRQLIAVFGCAGLRDVAKRPKMGRIACELADKIVLTAEDPRTEDVNEIINQIAVGCQNKNKIWREINRKKAISLAISLAKEGDIIGIFGKGHEQSMCLGTKEYPWSDQKAVKEIMKNYRREQ